MGRIFASVKKRKCKITVIGKVDESLLLLVGISKSVSERLSKEKGLTKEEAEKFVTDFINDGMKSIEK